MCRYLLRRELRDRIDLVEFMSMFKRWWRTDLRLCEEYVSLETSEAVDEMDLPAGSQWKLYHI